MRRSRLAIAVCCGSLALTAPASSLADSAGNQQYSDPFAGSGSGSGSATASHTATAPPSTSTAPPTSATPPPTTATPPSTASPSTASPAAPSSTATGPMATIASSSSSQTLPYTGLDTWTVAGFGAALLAGGLLVRRRVGAR